MIKIFKLFALFIFVGILFRDLYSQQNTNGWYWVNSQPQSNNLNWVKQMDAATYYAVGANGTFMKSTDGGDSWLINTQAGVLDPMFGSGGTFVLYTAWFFNANTGIVGGQSVNGDGGIIRRTTDGGTTFFDINLGLSSGLSRVKDITFLNSTTGFLCGNNTVQAMKTTDAGLTWTMLPNLPMNSYNFNCIYVKDENNILLGVEADGSSRNIMRTTNGGAVWFDDLLPGSGTISINDIEFLNVTTGYAGGNRNYFAYTTDGGISWTQRTYPNTNNGIYKLKIAGSTLYALSSYYTYYNTSNSGLTWDSVRFDDLSNFDQPFPYIVTDFDFYGNDVIVVGYFGKINISNDAGASWRNKNYSVGNCNYTFSSIQALPGTGQVWAGSNGGGKILYSTNSGANWIIYSTGAQEAIYDIEMKNSFTGYATGGNAFSSVGYCYKTTNSGINWTSLSIPTPYYQMNDASFIDVNTGWIVGGMPFNSGSEISKTTDGGLTWTSQVTTPLFFSAFGVIEMANANTGYLSSGSNVWKTTNGGTNWNMLTVTPSASWNAIKAFSENNVYFGGGQRINKTTDGGVTWTSVSFLSSLANLFSMDWTDQDNGTVVGTAGYTAKTKDGGLTWIERNPGSSTITGVSMVTADTVYAVCDRNVWGAVFKLIDPSSFNVNLTVGIEGFWNGSLQVTDTVKCHLRNESSPYAEVASSTKVLNNTGSGTFTFIGVPSGNYYLEITHRNSIETWSANPQIITVGGTHNYNFTSAASQAYGNNQIFKINRYCIFSGNANQDEVVDGTDGLLIDNDAANFATGYLVTDINGDEIIDGSDSAITDNNSSNFVSVVRP
ncbi:MAG: Ycf48-like protein [Ignavibacteria bacterium]|nr:Ycf48-like protein [Ignavibacteria bacterium]